MENHATKAWKIRSRTFVRRKKVGIRIAATSPVYGLVDYGTVVNDFYFSRSRSQGLEELLIRRFRAEALSLRDHVASGYLLVNK